MTVCALWFDATATVAKLTDTWLWRSVYSLSPLYVDPIRAGNGDQVELVAQYERAYLRLPTCGKSSRSCSCYPMRIHDSSGLLLTISSLLLRFGEAVQVYRGTRVLVR